ncbi:LacI family DNA-binding transcriptional regulator [Kitasatospora sp. NPDC057198]|uniref:LacI family DNA-binding transcriptional regulator n=1 Tax=Kitasatospora sp. NPDC057198 TaxID=3346046 RepID=UPI00362BD69C
MARRAEHHSGRYGLLTEVAAKAGVSLSTVSKVVHRRRDVGAETRARVEELLQQHGFVRYDLADPNRPRQVVAVFRDLSGPYTLEVTRGIVGAAEAMGLQLVVGTTANRSIAQWFEQCERISAVGLIIVISMLSDDDQRRIVEQGLPVVLIDPLSAPAAPVPSVGVTNWNGAREAVQHLVGLGHVRIAMVAGRSHSLAGAARLHGYHAALDEAGLPFDAALVRATDFDHEEALVVTRRLLQLPDPPTAVFAASDAQAMGVLEAARQHGLDVPDDLTVMSFDDTLVAAMATPPLSAVRQPFQELGHEATRVLVQLSEGNPPASARIELATELVLRASTAPPRRT